MLEINEIGKQANINSYKWLTKELTTDNYIAPSFVWLLVVYFQKGKPVGFSGNQK